MEASRRLLGRISSTNDAFPSGSVSIVGIGDFHKRIALSESFRLAQRGKQQPRAAQIMAFSPHSSAILARRFELEAAGRAIVLRATRA
jgi:hypothetical protein